jgi:hypothetical protein
MEWKEWGECLGGLKKSLQSSFENYINTCLTLRDIPDIPPIFLGHSPQHEIAQFQLLRNRPISIWRPYEVAKSPDNNFCEIAWFRFKDTFEIFRYRNLRNRPRSTFAKSPDIDFCEIARFRFKDTF